MTDNQHTVGNNNRTAPTTPPRIIRTDVARYEVVLGIVWLSFAAAISSLLEVVYLNARLPLPGGASIVFPVTVLVAFGFNFVLSRTATLWGRGPLVATTPLSIWLLVTLFLLLGATPVRGTLAAFDLRCLALLIAGIVGGGFGFRRR